MRAVSGFLASVLLVTALPATASITPVGIAPTPLPSGVGIPAPIESAPPPSQCGPQKNGVAAIDGVILDKKIATNQYTPAYVNSRVIVYPVAVDFQNKFEIAVQATVTAAYNMEAAKAAAKANPTSSEAAFNVLSTVNTYTQAQGALNLAYLGLATQSVSATLGKNGVFACQGFAPAQPMKMVATEYFNDSQGNTITVYYEGLGVALNPTSSVIPLNSLTEVRAPGGLGGQIPQAQ
jgi:hypothetical protein